MTDEIDGDDELLRFLDAWEAWEQSEPTAEPGDLMNSHGYPTDLAVNNILTFAGSPKQFVDFVNSLWRYSPIRVQRKWNELGYKVMEVAMVTSGWSGNETLITAVEQTMFSFAYWQMSQRGGLFVYEVPVEQWEEHWPSLGTYEHAMSLKDG